MVVNKSLGVSRCHMEKRGRTSVYGVGFVIDIVTGIVLDYEILSKYCDDCVTTQKVLAKIVYNLIFGIKVT